MFSRTTERYQRHLFFYGFWHNPYERKKPLFVVPSSHARSALTGHPATSRCPLDTFSPSTRKRLATVVLLHVIEPGYTIQFTQPNRTNPPEPQKINPPNLHVNSRKSAHSKNDSSAQDKITDILCQAPARFSQRNHTPLPPPAGSVENKALTHNTQKHPLKTNSLRRGVRRKTTRLHHKCSSFSRNSDSSGPLQTVRNRYFSR